MIRIIPVFILAASLTGSAALAQDTVYLRDGSIEYASISEINTRQIIYTPTDKPDGREQRLALGNIERIHYAGGRVQTFGGDARRSPADGRTPRRREPDVVYGKNIVSFAPIQITDEGARGVGLHYERILDQRGILSFYLPVSITFPDRQTSNFNDPFGRFISQRNATPFVYLYPGVRIYPAGANGKVRYAVGPSLVLGFGSIDYTTGVFNPATGQTQLSVVREPVLRSGILINNGLNIHATPKLVLGIEAGLGYSYLNDTDFENSTIFLGQLNFKIGYRF